MLQSIIFLSIAALLPVIALILFFLLNKYTGFKNLNFWVKQVIYGVVFGGLAIVGTHWSIPFDGAAANARDASVLIGGLVFGGPAGLIAGTIGGLERMIVGLVNPTKFGFTIIACSVSTFLAGVVSAIIRYFVFNKKRPGILSGFFIGLVVEVFHLLMVFVTNATQYEKAFRVVQSCTPPMLIANSISVLIALIVISALENGKDAFKLPDSKTLNSKFVVTLSALTFIAFILSSSFVYAFDDKMAKQQRDNDLAYAIAETANEISYKTIEKAYQIKGVLDRNPGLEAYAEPGDTYNDRLYKFCEDQGIIEINLIRKSDAYIVYANDPLNVGYTMNAENTEETNYDQSRDFHNKITDPNGPGYYVQEFRAPVTQPENLRKYAGVLFEFDFGSGTKEPGYIQVGYDKAGVDSLVGNIAYYKQIGNTGSIIILNDSFEAISTGKDSNLPTDITPLIEKVNKKGNSTTFEFETEGTSYYAQCKYEDTHYIISMITTKEADMSRNISVFTNTFLEIIVFGLFFITIYVLVKKLVIDRIEKTNDSLAKITAGDLNEVLDGGNVTEFQVLSKDINETVDALKGYIDAANKRIDEELAMAKAIQTAVLPSTFPAFPDRKEFDIYASMHAAKEVGGDFYDFYFSNQEHFHFTIADVSGKGIPAALFMMRAKSILKSLTQTNIPINDAFMKGNNALCEGNEAGMFVTAWSASVNLTNGELTFANGGHNPPLIKHKNGKFEYLRAPVNLVLAAMDGMPYGINKLQLEVGDIVYLYTDGVTEGVNTTGEQLGEERLQQILNSKEFGSCKELCEYVYNECVKFADGAAQFDDITMVAFRFDGFKK